MIRYDARHPYEENYIRNYGGMRVGDVGEGRGGPRKTF